MDFITGQIGSLQQLVDAATIRQRVLAQNIANVNTPHYQRHDVAFEDQLAQEMTRVGDRVDVEPLVFRDETPTERADGNNVDIDFEVGELNRNAMLYQTWLQVMSSRLNQLHHAIRGQ